MPIARKILICAAVDGLLIQPLASKGQRPSNPVRLKYGETWITNVPRDHLPDLSSPSASFEAFGIVGLISVSKLQFLVSITRREQVAQVRGFPVYVVTEVAITPCLSNEAAEKSIAKTSAHLRRQKEEQSEDDSDDSWEQIAFPGGVTDDVEDAVQSDEGRVNSPDPGEHVNSSIAEDVIRRKGSFGRFAQRWFSKSGWRQEQRRSMGLRDSAIESSSPTRTSFDDVSTRKISIDEEEGEGQAASTLLPKLLRTAHILFGASKSFYFSYDVNLTRSLGNDMLFDPQKPLCLQTEPMYCWNEHLLKPFSNATGESVAMPVMQGFVGQKTFVMDSSPPQVDHSAPDSMEMSTLSLRRSEPASPPSEEVKAEPIRETSELRPTEKGFLITLVSRRSRRRAGLRYLRRGIDDEGDAANSVETEQILSSPFWDSSSKTYSFTQVRGSIPLFWTQSPYSFKPVPLLQHSSEANYNAMKLHFHRLTSLYGNIQIVNLVEKHGNEAVVGDVYQRLVEKLNEDPEEPSKIPFEWFDFHAICRGMKFENVSLLLEKLKGTLDGFGSTIEMDGKVFTLQQGAVRTNCMDCLDRTNVCQSMFAKHMLEVQLKEEGFDMGAQADQNHWWFNNIWADNGDAISKQYSSTAAMKGDFTRTKKRDYRGTLNDLGLSLTRFYNGIVNDYFSQAAIDFLQGNVTSLVFSEFEANMMTKDPAVSVVKMRDQAIELCQKRVVADESEEFIGGWVMLSPQVSGIIRAVPLEEVVFLLTDAALYLCRFDWDLDKVSSFERVDLRHIVGIKFGTYITSTVSPVHMDELTNVGFVISYQPGKDDFKRTNTRTLSSLADKRNALRMDDAGNTPSVSEALANIFGPRQPGETVRRIAVKAPYAQSSMARAGDAPTQTEIQRVVTICAEVERLSFRAQPAKAGEERKSIVEKGDIISVEEAKRSTGLLEQLGHAFKRMVWA